MREKNAALPSTVALLFFLAGAKADAEPMLAIDGANGLYFFDSESSALGALHPVTGIAAGQTLATVDKRPLDDVMYGIANNASIVQLYRIDLHSFAATAVGSAFDSGSTVATFGMDFNPMVDRIRLVSAGGKNLRLNPATGTIVGSDTDISFAPMTFSGMPRVGAVAYSNNVANAATTIAYALEYTNDRLMTLGKADGSESPNGGRLYDVGALGVINNTNNFGLDISPTGRARALLTVGSTPALYSINLVSGAVALKGNFAAGTDIRDIAFIGDNVSYDVLFEDGFELP